VEQLASLIHYGIRLDSLRILEGSSLYTFLGDAAATAVGSSEPSSTNTIDKSKTSSNSDVAKANGTNDESAQV